MTTIDHSRFSEALDRLGAMMTGAHVAGMVALGLRLGLYQAMDGAGPLTSDELAAKVGMHERWVREWLFGQAAAGVVDHAGDERFVLSPEVAALLADPDSLFYLGGNFVALPNRLGLLPRLEDAFRSGRGLSFDERGPEAAEDTERIFGNWYRHLLVPVALPMLDGVVDRLHAGANVADVGCGSGVALVEMAKAFPSSAFHGYELSAHAIERAEAHRTEAGVDNVTFHHVDTHPLPADASFDLVCTFDCLHDMTHPEEAAAAVRRALRDDGTWFIADIRCAPTFEGNLERAQLAAMMYSMSVYSCMSSALAHPDGAGLGTCGLPEPAMRDLVTRAGFGSFRVVPLDHPVNAFYEARP
ncbi:MAG TPA: methyltransferase domain-containing protein [Acidimicrobiales bacterium]|nr:methyltransferase domain-containing protein [Acidimicrobiales bacterium]